MNTLRIKLNPYKDINIASLDDKPLSPYSELNNFMKEPFLKWANQLLEATEREINDDFKLVVVGEAFEKAFLKDMQSTFEGCVLYEEEGFQISNSVEERLQMAKALAEKYGVLYNVTNYCMPVYSDIPTVLDENVMIPVEMANASILVTANQNVVNSNVGGNTPKIFILKSDVNKITYVADMQYVWEVTEDRVNDILQIISDRFAKIPLIVDIAKALDCKRNEISKDDLDKIDLATEIDMFVTVDEIPELEVGIEYVPILKAVPAGNLVPQIRMHSLDPSVVVVDENKLIAQSAGKTVIEFYKSEEIIPFTKQEVTAFKDNNAQKIMLSVTEKKMGIGREQNIAISIIPEDADDANSIKWSVDDSELAVVDNRGRLVTKNAGKVTVTAQATHAKATIEVAIAPNITEISLSHKKVELFVGETQEISVSYLPESVFNSEVEWKTSDKDVAIIESTDDGKDIIRATGIGECQLTCIAKEGGCQAKCSVLVESTFKKRENMHSWLSFSFVSVIVAVLCAFFAIPAGMYGGAIASIVCGVIAILQNKKNIFWAIVMIVVSVLMIMS